MVNQTQLEGGWTELKGKIKETWGQISGDELTEFEGDVEQLVGMIEQKTGQAREEIERRLRELDDRFRPLLDRAAQTARQYVDQTAQAASDAAGYVRDQVATRHAEAEQMVRRRPMESVAVAFGSGIIAGVVVGLLLRSK